MTEKECFQCKLVTYDEIVEWTRDLAKKIRESDRQPTVVIGQTRGGWVPARMLCDLLAVKKLYAVKTEHWGVTANPDGKALLTQELNVDIDGEDVLLVDDITDTGESMSLAMTHLRDMHPRTLNCAALLHITRSKFTPDFYSVEVPAENWTWFIFPWNRNEDLRALLPKTLDGEKGEADIQKAFREQFQIDVPLEDVQMTLMYLEAAGTVKRSGDKWAKA